jgi:hypothetical protein
MAASFIKYNTATTAYFYIKNLTGYGQAVSGYSSYFSVWMTQDGGAVAQPAASLTEVSSSYMPGLYSCVISAAETAYGMIACALDPNMGYEYYQADPFYIFTDKNKMQADLQEVQGVTAPAGNIADFFDGTGYGIQPASTATEVQADVAKVQGVTGTAGNISDFFDGTGYGIQPASTATEVQADVAMVNASATAAKNLALGAESIQPAECASGSTTSSIVGTGSLKTVDAFYVDRMLIFTTGDLQYSARAVAAYDGSSKTFTMGTAFTSAPSSGDEFIIV